MSEFHPKVLAQLPSQQADISLMVSVLYCQWPIQYQIGRVFESLYGHNYSPFSQIIEWVREGYRALTEASVEVFRSIASSACQYPPMRPPNVDSNYFRTFMRSYISISELFSIDKN